MKTTNITNELVAAELQRIAKESGGILYPAIVVERASEETSPLHDHFEWSNDKAAHEHRLWQARQLIRITVHMATPDSTQVNRVWISLKSDRAHDGGYRTMVSVLSDEVLREQLLRDALEDLEYFQKKYRRLNELAEVFRAAQKVEVVHGKKKAARRAA